LLKFIYKKKTYRILVDFEKERFYILNKQKDFKIPHSLIYDKIYSFPELVTLKTYDASQISLAKKKLDKKLSLLNQFSNYERNFNSYGYPLWLFQYKEIWDFFKDGKFLNTQKKVVKDIEEEWWGKIRNFF